MATVTLLSESAAAADASYDAGVHGCIVVVNLREVAPLSTADAGALKFIQNKGLVDVSVWLGVLFPGSL